MEREKKQTNNSKNSSEFMANLQMQTPKMNWNETFDINQFCAV